jgi:tight adherence protein B
VRKKRIRLFEQQFPDAIDMMSNAIRSGFTLGKAMQLVADETLDPISMEFRKTCEEINLGIPIRDALSNLTKRVDSVDLKLFVTALMIQRESGGNLTEILDKIGATIRARFKLMGQIKVFTAQGRLSGWILGTLPAALSLILFAINREYIMILFTNPIGRMMIAFGITMQIFGFIVIQRIVQIKVQ